MEEEELRGVALDFKVELYQLGLRVLRLLASYAQVEGSYSRVVRRLA